MHPLTATFDAGRARLARNPAIAALADPDTPVSAKLAVVPTMAFWVLGFGDAMALLRRTSGTTPLDEVVKQHASEDADHWKWFVADLEALASQSVGVRSMSAAYTDLWGPTNAAVRECAWTLHHLLRMHSDPVTRLAILEACEHGFEVFMDSIRPVVQEAGQYGELLYLGEQHDHAEAGHALHEGADPFDDLDWSGQDVEMLRGVIDTIYECLDGMHTCYATAIAAAREREQVC